MPTRSFTKTIKLKDKDIPNLIKTIESTKKPKINKELKYKILIQD